MNSGIFAGVTVGVENVANIHGAGLWLLFAETVVQAKDEDEDMAGLTEAVIQEHRLPIV